jgi:hypothetical protein
MVLPFTSHRVICRTPMSLPNVRKGLPRTGRVACGIDNLSPWNALPLAGVPLLICSASGLSELVTHWQCVSLGPAAVPTRIDDVASEPVWTPAADRHPNFEVEREL